MLTALGVMAPMLKERGNPGANVILPVNLVTLGTGKNYGT